MSIPRAFRIVRIRQEFYLFGAQSLVAITQQYAGSQPGLPTYCSAEHRGSHVTVLDEEKLLAVLASLFRGEVCRMWK